jgi:hypothetical protein
MARTGACEPLDATAEPSVLSASCAMAVRLPANTWSVRNDRLRFGGKDFGATAIRISAGSFRSLQPALLTYDLTNFRARCTPVWRVLFLGPAVAWLRDPPRFPEPIKSEAATGYMAHRAGPFCGRRWLGGSRPTWRSCRSCCGSRIVKRQRVVACREHRDFHLRGMLVSASVTRSFPKSRLHESCK